MSEFNFKEWATNPISAQVELGKHNVTFGECSMVLTPTETDPGRGYIELELIFKDKRTVKTKFYSGGAMMIFNQINEQLRTKQTNWNSLAEWAQALKGKKVDVWVSRRDYINTQGLSRHTLQYDFEEPVVETAEDYEAESHLFD